MAKLQIIWNSNKKIALRNTWFSEQVWKHRLWSVAAAKGSTELKPAILSYSHTGICYGMIWCYGMRYIVAVHTFLQKQWQWFCLGQPSWNLIPKPMMSWGGHSHNHRVCKSFLRDCLYLGKIQNQSLADMTFVNFLTQADFPKARYLPQNALIAEMCGAELFPAGRG